MNALWFWLWCRWTQHRGAKWRMVRLRKSEAPDIVMRVCLRCDRVNPEDVVTTLDTIELDREDLLDAVILGIQLGAISAGVAFILAAVLDELSVNLWGSIIVAFVVCFGIGLLGAQWVREHARKRKR